MKDYSTAFANTNGVAFPLTGGVNASGPSATDGTEFVALFIDDLWGARQALMAEAGLTPDNVQESATASQFLEALQIVARSTRSQGNYVVNGSFNISQENTTFTLAAGVAQWTLDMHQVTSIGGNAVVTHIDNPISISKNKKAMRITGAAGVTEVIKQTRIEAKDAANLRRKVVYSTIVENNSGNAITPVLSIRHANVEDNFGATTEDDSNVFAAIADGATETLEYAVDLTSITNLANGCELKLTLGTGSFTSGTIDLGEEQFEDGTIKSEFEHEHVTETLVKCQRYWESSYNEGVGVGATTNVGQRKLLLTALPSATHQASIGIDFSVSKRITPAMTYYSPSTGTSGKVYDSQAATDVAAVDSNPGECGATVLATQLVAAVVIDFTVHYVADARLD